jgi:hypothetical protein
MPENAKYTADNTPSENAVRMIIYPINELVTAGIAVEIINNKKLISNNDKR